MSFNKFDTGLESISFQSGLLHKNLIGIFDNFNTKNYKQIEHAKNPKEISYKDLEMELIKCIDTHTNLIVNISIDKFPACIEAPRIDKNNPMTEVYGWNIPTHRVTLKDIRNAKDKNVKATIDLDKCQVGGFFRKMMPPTIHLNEYDVFFTHPAHSTQHSFTTAEMSASLLHEVGHYFSYLEYLIRFRTTNQILSTTYRLLEQTESPEERNIIIGETSKALDLTELQVGDLGNKSNTTVFTVLVTTIARKNKSQSGSSGYDITSFEALSDQFAARHGAAKDLATTLNKINRYRISKRSLPMYLFVEAVKVGLGVAGVFFPPTLFSLLILIVADSQHDWYDKDGYRLKRIRNQLIEQLKDTTLPKDLSDRIREDINVIEDINKDYKDNSQIVGLIYDYLIPGGINNRKTTEFQQRLEELSSNKLFYFANQFKYA